MSLGRRRMIRASSISSNPIAALGTLPDEGFCAAFFDGHVQWISKNIDPKVLKALITPSGGEAVDRGSL